MVTCHTIYALTYAGNNYHNILSALQHTFSVRQAANLFFSAYQQCIACATQSKTDAKLYLLVLIQPEHWLAKKIQVLLLSR